MNDAATQSVIVEREIPFPPEKIWRALTQPQLIAEWLMDNDFALKLDHRFSLRANWGAVDCQVLEIEPERTLAYTWGDSRLKSVVTWTLTPSGDGTRLSMVQSGFRDDQPRYFQGARAGWPQFFDKLEQTLAGLT